MTLANYAMKLEREVWGVLEGPWGGDTWMGWRRDWAQKVTFVPGLALLQAPLPCSHSLPCYNSLFITTETCTK